MDRPKNLLEALCRVSSVQGGTIHQYDLRRLRWTTIRRGDSKANRSGTFGLVYSAPNGCDWCIGFIGGGTIADIRRNHPIEPEMRICWETEAEPDNDVAMQHCNAQYAGGLLR